jgi:integrase
VPKQRKYQDQEDVLDAINNGTLDTVEERPEKSALYSYLDGKEYDSQHFFYWFKLFVRDFNEGVSKRGRVRSATTKAYGYRRFVTFVKYALENGWDTLPPASITSDQIGDYLFRWNKLVRTKKMQYSDLRHLFNWLLKQRGSGVQFNPTHTLAVPRYVVKKTPKITDADIIPRLFMMIEKVPRKGSLRDVQRQRALDKALLAFAISTAARRSAIAQIQTSRINWTEHVINYDDKGKFGVVSPIVDCQTYLEGYLRLRKLHCQSPGESRAGYLMRIAEFNRIWATEDRRPVDPDEQEADDYFFRRHDGLPLTPHFVSSMFKRWSKWLTPKNSQTVLFRPHMIRKYRGMLAYAQTKDLNLVKNLMNHSTLNQTLEYLEISIEERINFLTATSPLAAFTKGL